MQKCRCFVLALWLRNSYLPTVDFLKNKFLIGQLIHSRSPFVFGFNVRVTQKVIVTRFPTRPANHNHYYINTVSVRNPYVSSIGTLRFHPVSKCLVVNVFGHLGPSLDGLWYNKSEKLARLHARGSLLTSSSSAS